MVLLKNVFWKLWYTWWSLGPYNWWLLLNFQCFFFLSLQLGVWPCSGEYMGIGATQIVLLFSSSSSFSSSSPSPSSSFFGGGLKVTRVGIRPGRPGKWMWLGFMMLNSQIINKSVTKRKFFFWAFELGFFSFLYSYYFCVCTFHSITDFLSVLCQELLRFNIFFDQCINFFYSILYVWNYLFHLFYSVGNACV